uniref:Uncharacterized protein n=1 Tax=Arundo donax TaxID=35708 RepID=A0A0A9HH31_ARUDO
MHIVSGGWS